MSLRKYLTIPTTVSQYIISIIPNIVLFLGKDLPKIYKLLSGKREEGVEELEEEGKKNFEIVSMISSFCHFE